MGHTEELNPNSSLPKSEIVESKGLVKTTLLGIAEWVEAVKGLSNRERVAISVGSLMQVLPHGIGGALAQAYWGTLDKRQQRKYEDTVDFLSNRVAIAESDISELREYYKSDEFASLVENLWIQIDATGELQKLEALRGALASVITQRPNLAHRKREGFVLTLQRVGVTELDVLRSLAKVFVHQPEDPFLDVPTIYALNGAEIESDRDFVFGTIDVLANLRFIIHGNIPRSQPEGPVDVKRQTFRCTALGMEFLDFVRQGFNIDLTKVVSVG